jgi:uncharacterized membrane protein
MATLPLTITLSSNFILQCDLVQSYSFICSLYIYLFIYLFTAMLLAQNIEVRLSMVCCLFVPVAPTRSIGASFRRFLWSCVIYGIVYQNVAFTRFWL